ncbi:RsmB/NOP family class I SAM-dependent RNA methyltransferase [Pseudoroseicyclus aestuarii]|uniref:16S rRNA (Cytosine967-C5)-methyltransferase n=1 Tax=Pseudoroseicyclus aestuarii TaxID=1795041 RepID=A0A318SU70_9RHOB|nr:methyltransferase domain-containing protein [Pseudoroseicyclus aestuarii]PYE83919.1 16S rRNA (cytosine967-C5)-methyltransferase [Pseudoroseicyclus aestuarii]
MTDRADAQDALAARRAALSLLTGVTAEGRLLSDPSPMLDRLAPEDRARAQRLAGAALRGMARADALLAPHLRKAPPLAVRNALRLACVELALGGAAHGVVGSWVEVVKAGKRTGAHAGLTNAVLRKIAPEAEARWPALPVPKLPPWLRRPLVEAWGRPAVEAMEAAHLAGAPLDLTARGDAAALAQAVGGTLLPGGTVRLEAGQVTALPGYEEGAFWVQDTAAAMAARILAPQAGEAVLDLCAAPGGKTLQLAAAGARVTAVDLSDQRLGRLRANLARTGLEAEVVAQDALAFDRTGWDAILLDAPCSATGTIRRHPDLPVARDGAEIGGLIDLQAAMIDHALSLLKPGGRLVFCTCSLIPDEGEVQIAEALERHPDLSVERAALEGVPEDWWGEEGLRLRPDYLAEAGGMDGFFIGCLRKPG